MAMTRPSSGPAQEGAHARPSSARLHFTGTFYPNQSSVKIGDERKKASIESGWPTACRGCRAEGLAIGAFETLPPPSCAHLHRASRAWRRTGCPSTRPSFHEARTAGRRRLRGTCGERCVDILAVRLAADPAAPAHSCSDIVSLFAGSRPEVAHEASVSCGSVRRAGTAFPRSNDRRPLLAEWDRTERTSWTSWPGKFGSSGAAHMSSSHVRARPCLGPGLLCWCDVTRTRRASRRRAEETG